MGCRKIPNLLWGLTLAECIACKSHIPDGAAVCSVCKCYQSMWKNNLQYVAGISALILFVLSSAVWVVPRVWSSIFHLNDVRIVAASTLKSVVIANFTDEDVFVSHFIFWMTGRTSSWIAPGVPIEETIHPGSIVSRAFPAQETSSPIKILPGLQVLRGASQEKIEDLIVRSVSGDPCVKLVFFAEEDYNLKELRGMAGPTLNTFPVNAYLEFWSGHNKKPQYTRASGVGAFEVCDQVFGEVNANPVPLPQK